MKHILDVKRQTRDLAYRHFKGLHEAKELDFGRSKDAKLGVSGMTLLSEWLRDNDKITRLMLPRTSACNEGVSVLARLLHQGHPSLTYLDLRNSGVQRRGLEALARALLLSPNENQKLAYLLLDMWQLDESTKSLSLIHISEPTRPY